VLKSLDYTLPLLMCYGEVYGNIAQCKSWTKICWFPRKWKEVAIPWFRRNPL